MKKILALLKSRLFLGMLGVALLLFLLMVLGTWMGWSMTVRLMGVIGVLALSLTILLVSFMRAQRSAANIEAQIRSQGDDQRMSTRPEKREEIEQLQKELISSIERLKASKLGRGHRAPLYALPWYMMIGPAGAGKTVALANSGLDFPLGAGRRQGVGGTRNCDWFFSDAAILLDTAGRYMTEHEDTDEWLAFLDVLRRHRSSQPVNGVIVGISIDKLAGASPEDIEWHANKIRRRIDELIEHLGVRFPVYLVFTKCDLLRGFVEFFDDLTPEEKQQVWGASFAKDRLATENEDARAIFSEEFDQLHETLLARRTERLSRTADAEQRRRVFLFPMAFGAVKGDVQQFVWWLFQPNPYQESPVWRGFYFTSGTQDEGQILDLGGAAALEAERPPRRPGGERRARPEAARPGDNGPLANGGAPVNEAAPGSAAPGEGRAVRSRSASHSYFIKELFTDIIIPDQYLVKRTTDAARRKRSLLAGVSVATVLALVLFTASASRALVRSLGTVRSVEAAAEQVQPVRWQGPGGQTVSAEAQRKNFQRLDGLYAQVAALEDHAEEATLLSWGLHRGDELLGPARALQVQTARAFVRHYPYQRLRRGLQRAVAGSEASSGSRTSVYNDLKAYMLLTSDAGRLDAEADRTFLRTYLMDQVELTEQLRPAEREQGRQRIAAQLGAFVNGLRAEESRPFAGDPALVSDVRDVIYEPPSIERIYARLKEEGNQRTPSFTLADALQRRGQDLFATRPEVPGFFTREAWDGYVEEAIEAQASKPSQADWVMGYTAEDLPGPMRDAGRVVDALREMYFSEYGRAWERFLGGVRVRRFGSAREAARALERLGSAYDSPLLYLLAQATYETTFDSGLSEEAQNRAEEAARRAAERRARRTLGRAGRLDDTGSSDEEANQHPITAQFRWLHALGADKAQSGGASPDLVSALRSLAEVGNSLRGAAQNRAKAADFAADVLSEDGGALLAALTGIRGALSRVQPNVRSRLFADPVEHAWAGVLADAQQHLDQRWREEVCQPYQAQLSGRFPLDLDSDRDVPLNDFERFFRPQEGVLATFYNDALAPFLGERDAHTWSEQGLRVSPQVRAALAQARRLRQGLFNGDAMRVAFELQAEQPASQPEAPAAGQVYIDVHGSQVTYGMGNYRPWTSFEWPAGSGAVLRVSTREGALTLAAQGAWAWFRLLKKARVQARTSTRFDVRWPVGEGVVARYTLRTNRTPNPYGDLRSFFGFACPPTLAAP